MSKNTIERDTLLTALYNATSKTELLNQFDSKLSEVKGKNQAIRYTHLLEQIVFYSHAIIFGHGVQTAHNYRQTFMSTAKANKKLKLGEKDIEKAFSFLNRTIKKNTVKKIESGVTDKRALASKDDCIAIEEIKRLKAQLDNNTYKLARGQKVEDKEAFIRIALVALSTGARLSDIMEDLVISTKKGVTLFNDTESVILVLDTKTVQLYLRAIRSHYKDRLGGSIDISTGIRKAIKKLDIYNAGNLNHLNNLYKACIK